MLGPAGEEGASIERWRNTAQLFDFRSREEAARDFGILGPRPFGDPLDINADVHVPRDSDQGEIGGVREIECQPAAEVGAQRGLAVGVVFEADIGGLDAQITAEQLTQGATCDDKALPVSCGAKARASGTLVR